MMGKTYPGKMMLVVSFLFLIFRLGAGTIFSEASSSESGFVEKTYPEEIFPLFKKALLEVVASDAKIKVLFDHLNQHHATDIYHTVDEDYTPVYQTESAEEPVYTEVPDLSAEEPIYTEVPDLTADEPVYTSLMTIRSSDEPLYIVPGVPLYKENSSRQKQTQDEFFYASLVPDQTADEKILFTLASDEEQSYHAIRNRMGTFDEPTLPSIEITEDSSLDLSHENFPLQAGSIRGIPGEHFPDYYDIPITSFTCADKDHIPGFYADLETGCQVFHVCWPNRRESFLCPVGTTFNQAILTCDYWYSSNCSLAPLFFDVNTGAPEAITETENTATMIDELIKSTRKEETVTTASPLEKMSTWETFYPTLSPSPDTADLPSLEWSQTFKFIPIKSKITYYPESGVSKLHHSHLKPKHVVNVHVGKEEPGKLKLDGEEQETVSSQLDEEQEMASSLILNGVLKATRHTMKEVQELIPDMQSTKQQSVQKPLPDSIQRSQMKPVGKRLHIPKTKSRFAVKPKQKHTIPTGFADTKRMPQTSKSHISKSDKEHYPEIVLRALETAGSLLHRDILPLARKAVIKSNE